ncbi:MAG TPA: hypothetical protein VFG59_12705 [Anaeromyxobacter sp.]|nr:hypothetical protein [Anaeromyxobacter sp.]
MPAGPRKAADSRAVNGAASAFDPALPMFSELMQGLARTLRDVEALRYAMLSLMPEPDRVLAVRLIQKRYRIGKRRARQILGLPLHPEVSP